MDNKQQNNGKDFWNVVQDAINTGNYSQLNQQVQSTINDSVEGIRHDMGYDRYQGKGVVWRDSENTIQNAYWKPVNTQHHMQPPAQNLYARRPSGQTSGTALSIVGYTLSAMCYLGTAVLSAVNLVMPWGGLMAGATITGVVGTAFLAAGVVGTSLSKRARKFIKYAKVIGNRDYCQIEEISEKTGISQKKVIKDLRGMIEKKMFLQGHIDKKETCLILTDKMYEQYLETEKQAQTLAMEEQRKEEKMKSMPEECQKVLQEGNWYINYIRLCNDDIPGEEMSNKLYRLEDIITRIFKEVEKKHELAGDLRKFMNYYLPTTKKLLDVYRDMDKETIAASTIETTKKEIEDTVDTINQAFENLLNSFFKDKALDVSSDISVLNTMLAQEGLTNSDFVPKQPQEKENKG